MDDEQTVRLVLQEMLRFLGYDPAFTVDGEEAIDTYKTAMAEGTPFDAVIMDLTIPGGMGGLEAIGRLREIDPHVRAIVSSGYASDAVVADFRKHGFSGVLSKPYQMEALSELLSTLTGGAKACDGEAVVEEAG
jgi:CheY-like chemotaxis protein